jgi:hypothetical protein
MDNGLQLDVTLLGHVQLSNSCLNYWLPLSDNYLELKNNDGDHLKAIQSHFSSKWTIQLAQPLISSFKLKPNKINIT